MTKTNTDQPIGILLYRSVAEPTAIDVAANIGETILDNATDNEALKIIPVFGALLKIGQGVIDFRNKMYIRKIAKFIFESTKLTEEDRSKYQEKLLNDEDECQKSGEAILEILDKITGIEKATLIGKLFRAYIREDLPVDKFILYAEMIERVHLYDLHVLLTKSISSKNSQGLINSGIVELFDLDTIYRKINETMGYALSSGGLSSSVSYHPSLTDAGSEIKRILNEY
jgi:hypothetical protein